MIDPITATFAANAGANILSNLMGSGAADAATKAAATKASKAFDDVDNQISTDSIDGNSFENLLSSASNKKAIEKLLSIHPELKAKLGSGPYSMTESADGTLVISSSFTGQSVKIDPDSALGQEAKALAQASHVINHLSEIKYSDKLQDKASELLSGLPTSASQASSSEASDTGTNNSQSSRLAAAVDKLISSPKQA